MTFASYRESPTASRTRSGVAEGAKYGHPACPEFADPTGGVLTSDAAIPAAVSDPTHEQKHRIGSHSPVDLRTYDVPRIVQIAHVSANPGVAAVHAALLAQCGKERLPLNLRIGQVEDFREVSP